jgi:hypothetical protein
METNSFLVKINNDHDNVIDVMYENYKADALELKNYLINSLVENEIDYKEFNKNAGSEPSVIENPPTEIYEYQLFFLLRRKDNSYVLLDGFRRLLWYNTPKCFINVRVYDENELTDHKIMKLLVYFNHLKFYGTIGKYYDRGYALAMRTIFDLNILSYDKVFDSYLSTNDTTKKYWTDRVTSTVKIERVKERMLNPFFVSDMKFIEAISKTSVMMNDVFGALVFEYRTKFMDKEFDINFFIEKINENKFIKELHDKFEKNGDGNGAKQQEIINQLIKLYTNIFNEMFGLETIKTYTEILAETKAMVVEMKKDKSYMKLSGYQKSYLVEMIFRKRINEKKPIVFKGIVHPLKDDNYNSREYTLFLKPGIIEEEIKITKVINKMFNSRIEIGFTKEGVLYTSRNHEFDPNFKKLKGTYPNNRQYDVDIFVDITPEEIEWMDKNRKID